MKRKIITFGILLILLTALPLILLQVQKQQETRQRAAEMESFHISLLTQKADIKEGESSNVIISLSNPTHEDISGVDLTIEYPSDILDLNHFSPNIDLLAFTTVVNDTSIPGKIRYVAVNTNPQRQNIYGFDVGDISFKRKIGGVGAVRFSNVVVTAKGKSDPLTISSGDYTPVVYAVGAPTPTPAITSSISPVVSQTVSPTTTVLTTSPTIAPELPMIQLALDNQIIFEGDRVIVSAKVDSGAVAMRLFYSVSDEIPSGEFFTPWNPNIFKYCNPENECLGNFNISVPKGEMLRITAKAQTAQGNFVVSEVKSLPIRHFSASVNPSESSLPGTLFAITAKTEIGSKVEGVINGPGINNSSVTFYDDGIHGDGKAGDGLYGYVFHSPESKIGTYQLNFEIDGQKMPRVSFVTDYPNDACKPFMTDGPNASPYGKINIVVVSSNYSENELDRFQSEVLSDNMNFLFSKEPYLSNKDKFNVWFIKKHYSVDCAYENAWGCFSAMEKNIVSICPFMDKAIVFNKGLTVGGYGADKIAVVNSAISDAWSNGITLHELGHTLGQLADEYNGLGWYPSSNTSAANCDVYACPKWCSGKSDYEDPQCGKITSEEACESKSYNGVKCVWYSNRGDLKCSYPYFSDINFGQACIKDSVCLYGCGGPNGYRSSNYSVMGNLGGDVGLEYNTVSKIQIQKMIDSLWQQK